MNEDHIVRTVLESAEQRLKIALDFNMRETWTICIYKSIPDEGTARKKLKCIAHERSIKCDIGLAREWPEGHGVAGVALAQQREILVPDLRAPELGSLYNLARLTKEDDDERYRSIVAVPVRLEPDACPWGMVVATSSRPGHFQGDGPSVRPIEGARALASMVALAVLTSRMPRVGGAPSIAPAAGA